MGDAGFERALRDRDEITISVKGRRTGKSISLPVWFVVEGQTLWLLPVRGRQTQWFRNLRVDPSISVRAGRSRRTFKARPVLASRTVKAAVQKFRTRYTRDEVARWYSGFDAAVRVVIKP